ncbi:CLUMA_CG010399, isoform A [Clunio marinus]|uniref:CLUMA_CG010399, isoform A n=1 Tax=Clunio marinus TaxID=568069 RepID=A0A1J1IDE3_9DIPT|nr:CLUMA_CG010399, isoform A [Clunio marinus]
MALHRRFVLFEDDNKREKNKKENMKIIREQENFNDERFLSTRLLKIMSTTSDKRDDDEISCNKNKTKMLNYQHNEDLPLMTLRVISNGGELDGEQL